MMTINSFVFTHYPIGIDQLLSVNVVRGWSSHTDLLFQGINLKFAFPFYGHLINKVLVATGGKYQSIRRRLTFLVF